ncbi:ABC transporter permease [Corynebacterium pseudotuberculosis]|uniref:ABC transporter permease n=1 Tax=Corynebacterium pseudotuberculosis TaxID=1719 RepID=UPI00026606CC|nr:ABC transporter permease [Corynebacterium pseudotuberculosis]AFM08176.1 FtsX-like permease family protein [Corynebacterium pseudotuberculosis Cp162]APG82582.1 Macrolide export ATP-binding/permease protein [Corynebacterium pseudotuberculosis]WFP67000.1 ABC transporter permease [Corynebacterium pseudotuberculosis]
MTFGESISLALSSLRVNKMRSLLTLLGIIVGIASVIAILTLGKSLQAQTTKSLADAGANDLTIQVTERNKSKDGEQAGFQSSAPVDDSAKLTPDLINQLKNVAGNSVDGISVGEFNQQSATLGYGIREEHVNVLPVNNDYLKIKKINAEYGRVFTPEDTNGERAVAVISPTTLEKLFANDPDKAVGAEIDARLPNGTLTSLVVVGVAPKEKSGAGLFGGNTQSNLYVPYTIQSRFNDKPIAWDSVSVRLAQGADESAVRQTLRSVLDSYYADNSEYHAEVRDNKSAVKSFNATLENISAVVSAIAGISLLVGGIGVMNIMLVTVTERTREIGVRKALGARRRDIKLQFIVESMIICSIGGAIGVFLGGTTGMVGSFLLKELVIPPVGGILLSLGFSLAIGLFFGYYPANKAAKLNPIDALRYE